MQLEADIDGINSQLRGIDTSWPGGSIALVVIGSVLSPSALVGLILMVFPPIGIPFLAVGLGGVAMIVVGAVGGSRAKDEAVGSGASMGASTARTCRLRRAHGEGERMESGRTAPVSSRPVTPSRYLTATTGTRRTTAGA